MTTVLNIQNKENIRCCDLVIEKKHKQNKIILDRKYKNSSNYMFSNRLFELSWNISRL